MRTAILIKNLKDPTAKALQKNSLDALSRFLWDLGVQWAKVSSVSRLQHHRRSEPKLVIREERAPVQVLVDWFKVSLAGVALHTGEVFSGEGMLKFFKGLVSEEADVKEEGASEQGASEPDQDSSEPEESLQPSNDHADQRDPLGFALSLLAEEFPFGDFQSALELARGGPGGIYGNARRALGGLLKEGRVQKLPKRGGIQWYHKADRGGLVSPVSQLSIESIARLLPRQFDFLMLGKVTREVCGDHVREGTIKQVSRALLRSNLIRKTGRREGKYFYEPTPAPAPTPTPVTAPTSAPTSVQVPTLAPDPAPSSYFPPEVVKKALREGSDAEGTGETFHFPPEVVKKVLGEIERMSEMRLKASDLEEEASLLGERIEEFKQQTEKLEHSRILMLEEAARLREAVSKSEEVERAWETLMKTVKEIVKH